MKNIVLLISVVLLSLTTQAQKKENTYKVIAACGTCNFNMSSPTGCALAIQVAGKYYWVDGSTLQDHGNEHNANGMCKVTRKAEVQGTFKGNRFNAKSFALLPDKKKK
ncbi:hypothetical protein FRY74_01465 [Vicingus serpentipes]|uniref:Glutaminyl-tRNA synthetase n=1 Tax=Vicingus serpentipes TaxID=1926625 RepID=A0A5C6RXU9_9FLAO|nr:DUF6370 family protein [Vicingus serpentipes]TXB66877.1 hypothetical protein FRY74_01465 [Vicingus serpentipes]